MRVVVRAAVAVVVLACSTGLRAGEPELDAAALDKSLRRMDGYLERHSFEKGLRELRALVDQHGEKAYVRARRAELEDYARRFAFGAGYAPATAGQVLRGRVQDYDPDSGKLKVEYTPEQAAQEFRRLSNDTVAFFADTLGPFTLEIWGSSMPPASGDLPWMEFSGGENPRTGKNQVWHVYFGSPDKLVGAKTVYAPAEVWLIEDGQRKKVSTSHAIPGDVGKPYVVQINVGHTTLEAGTNGSLVGRARKERGQWGWIHFHVPRWTRLKFNGYIEPAYVQDRLDAVHQQQLADFRAKFRRESYLPGWLFKPRAKVPATSRRLLPAEVDTKLHAGVRLLQRHILGEAWTDARSQLAALEKDGLPQPVGRWFSARLHYGQEDWAAGLRDAEAVLADAPDFLEASLLRGRLLGRLRRPEDASSTFRGLAEAAAADPEVYETAILALLDAGRPEAAQEFVERAAERQVDSAPLDVLARTVVQARKGPAWSRVYDYKSRNYHVYSDISKGTCVETARLLEQALTGYRVYFRWVGRDDKQVFPVYVFSGKAGFDQYIADLGAIYGSPHSQVVGVYSQLTRQLLISNQGERAAVQATMRHEGFHQYLDSFTAEMPRWLNEGLAVYHEVMARSGGDLKLGDVHPSAYAALKQGAWVPLATFVHETPAEFYKHGYPGYAQAWLLAHLLMEGGSRWRSLGKAIVEDLGTLGTREILAKHFPPDVVADLESAARAHLGQLGRRR